jgi:hypothetical protein
MQRLTPWWKKALGIAAVGGVAAGLAVGAPAGLAVGAGALLGAHLLDRRRAGQAAAPLPAAPGMQIAAVPAVYTQRTDPSLFGPHAFSSHNDYIGGAAMEKQRRGVAPSATDVRVAANSSDRWPHQRGGAGLDEFLPTDQGASVAHGGHAADRGFQSGARFATDLTTLMAPMFGATGHTNRFPNPHGTGSTNLTGQKYAHDIRRRPTSATNQDERFLHFTLNSIESLAHGPASMAGGGTEGGTSNYVGASAIGAPGLVPPDPARIREATQDQQVREHYKDRARTLAQAWGSARQPSPERVPLQADGSGGGYRGPHDPVRPRSPVPAFGGTQPDERYANAAGWMTAPGRHGAQAMHLTKRCENCWQMNRPSAAFCAGCNQHF